MTGPLTGVRIIEIASLGPGPFCGMMLADHGAEVIRVDRHSDALKLGGDPAKQFLNRSRRTLAVDLKSMEGNALVQRLCRAADGVIEGFRPGVMERLGLGPEVLMKANPKLVYGRMTGWGQSGPYASMAGHDINYIALSGALHAIGRVGEKPVPPLNLVGDFGGGGMMLAFGMLAAIINARQTGVGQVVDCAMTEGSAVLMAMIYSFRASGIWNDRRGVNFLDSAAHFYDSYETADGKFIALGPVEPQFYRELLERSGLGASPDFNEQMNPELWPHQKEKFAKHFRTKTRAEWCEIFEGTDACFAPILSMDEAPTHPHNMARGAFVEVDGVMQPAPAPRYSSTLTAMPTSMACGEKTTTEILAEIGYSADEMDRLRATGTVQ